MSDSPRTLPPEALDAWAAALRERFSLDDDTLRGPAAERYECRYRGAFLGAGVAGPFRNGAACKSAYGRDPLEGIELEIVERTEAVEPDAEEATETFMPDYEIVYGSY